MSATRRSVQQPVSGPFVEMSAPESNHATPRASRASRLSRLTSLFSSTSSITNNNARAVPSRVFEYQPEDLYTVLQHKEEDVLAAIDGTLVDRYLETMARDQLEEVEGSGNETRYSRKHSTSNPPPRVSFNPRYTMASAMSGGEDYVTEYLRYSEKDFPDNARFSSAKAEKDPVTDMEAPPTKASLPYQIHHPNRLNFYLNFKSVFLIVVPFGILVPVALFCVVLAVYTKAKVRLCDGNCPCDTGDVALITFTFGLLRDLPCSIVFSCLTEACIDHQRDAAQTTTNRKLRANALLSRSRPMPTAVPITPFNNNDSFQTKAKESTSLMIGLSNTTTAPPTENETQNTIASQLSSQTRYSAIASRDASQSPPNYHGAFTYGPYVLEGGLSYLRRRRVQALIVTEQLFVMLVRAFASPLGVPTGAVTALVMLAKIIPFILYAIAKRNASASSSVSVLIIMPMLLEILSEAGTAKEGTSRDYWTAFFPILVLLVDRFFLYVMNFTSHPSRSSGAVICFCTMHAFFMQNTLLGVALTIDAQKMVGPVIAYAFIFTLSELLLNTVIIDRLIQLTWNKMLWLLGAGVPVTRKDRDSLGKFSTPNISSLVRLPTLWLSFIFMLPAMHFPMYPYKTVAVECDGTAHYNTSWPTYGLISGIILLVSVVTITIRRSGGVNNVPLCVFGVSWSLIVSTYLLQCVPQSLAFMATIAGTHNG